MVYTRPRQPAAAASAGMAGFYVPHMALLAALVAHALLMLLARACTRATGWRCC